MSHHTDDDRSLAEQLDWKSQEILWALAEQDGTADTSEIRALTGLENNDHVLYRLREKLVPGELVEVMQPEVENNQIPAKVVTLTPAGEAVAEKIVERQETPTDISDRIERLETEVSQVQTHLEESDAQETTDDHAAGSDDIDLKELDHKVDELWDALAVIRDYIETENDVDLATYDQQETEGPTNR